MADYFNKLMTANEIRDAFFENDDKNALCFLLKGVISDLSALEERVEVLEEKVATLEENEEATAEDIESIHNSITAIQNSITSITANLAEITANFSNYYTKTETENLIAAEIGDAISDEY